jgi:hypothetical protein
MLTPDRASNCATTAPYRGGHPRTRTEGLRWSAPVPSKATPSLGLLRDEGVIAQGATCRSRHALLWSTANSVAQAAGGTARTRCAPQTWPSRRSATRLRVVPFALPRGTGVARPI